VYVAETINYKGTFVESLVEITIFASRKTNHLFIDSSEVITITTISSLQQYLSLNRRQKKGFVPTMGALHQGHLSLIDEARAQSDITIVSIYVNPTQFNESSDLQNYPRTLSQDVLSLVKKGCDVLFLPTDREMYPDGLDKSPPLDISAWASTMEGEFRPGHFDGMARVMYRFIEILKPDKVFMGQKDYQQYKIVDQMSDELDLGAEIIACPIIREENGLAMSSRNLRLTAENRREASKIHETLQEGAERLRAGSSSSIVESWAMDQMLSFGFRPEYFKVVDKDSLEPLDEVEPTREFIICTAAWVGEVRLIDNIWIRPQEEKTNE
jgi:pantoate--beta-alanine ligase